MRAQAALRPAANMRAVRPSASASSTDAPPATSASTPSALSADAASISACISRSQTVCFPVKHVCDYAEKIQKSTREYTCYCKRETQHSEGACRCPAYEVRKDRSCSLSVHLLAGIMALTDAQDSAVWVDCRPHAKGVTNRNESGVQSNGPR